MLGKSTTPARQANTTAGATRRDHPGRRGHNPLWIGPPEPLDLASHRLEPNRRSGHNGGQQQGWTPPVKASSRPCCWPQDRPHGLRWARGQGLSVRPTTDRGQSSETMCSETLMHSHPGNGEARATAAGARASSRTDSTGAKSVPRTLRQAEVTNLQAWRFSKNRNDPTSRAPCTGVCTCWGAPLGGWSA
jgi:hypothetical protein